MKRDILAVSGLIVVTVATVALFAWFGSLQKDEGLLSLRVGRMEDSLSLLRRSLDSLKARTPGLGDYMSTIQLHVAKLWYAGASDNWKLAGYELGELDETMEGAEALHATKRDVDISAVLESIRNTQLPLLLQSIAHADTLGFRAAYSQTLAACNGCHRPAGYEFIRIITPTQEPVVNQQWSAPE